MGCFFLLEFWPRGVLFGATTRVGFGGWMDGWWSPHYGIWCAWHNTNISCFQQTSSRDGGTYTRNPPTNQQPSSMADVLLLLQDPIKYVTHPHRHPSSVRNGNKAKWNGTWTGFLKAGRYKSIESGGALQKAGVPLNRSKLTCSWRYVWMDEPRIRWIKDDVELNKKKNSNWIAFQNFKSHIEGVAESRGLRRGKHVLSHPILILLPLHLFLCRNRRMRLTGYRRVTICCPRATIESEVSISKCCDESCFYYYYCC